MEYIPLKSLEGELIGHARVKDGFVELKLRGRAAAGALILTETGSRQGRADARIAANGRVTAVAAHENGRLVCYGAARGAAVTPLELRRFLAEPAFSAAPVARVENGGFSPQFSVSHAVSGKNPPPSARPGAHAAAAALRAPAPKTAPRAEAEGAASKPLRAEQGAPTPREKYHPVPETIIPSAYPPREAPQQPSSPSGHASGAREAPSAALRAEEPRMNAPRPEPERPYVPEPERPFAPVPGGPLPGTGIPAFPGVPMPGMPGMPIPGVPFPVLPEEAEQPAQTEERLSALRAEIAASAVPAAEIVPAAAFAPAAAIAPAGAFVPAAAIAPATAIAPAAEIVPAGAGMPDAEASAADSESFFALLRRADAVYRAAREPVYPPAVPEAAAPEATPGRETRSARWHSEVDALLAHAAQAPAPEDAPAEAVFAENEGEAEARLTRLPMPNPFPHIFPGARFTRQLGEGGAGRLEGEWRQGGERMRISAVPGSYSPQPPAQLAGYTRFIRSRMGGFWVKVTQG